jgi:hypothetical protein
VRRPVRPLAGLAALGGLLLTPAPALAGDPIMPLSSVHGGMECTGYSVIAGTDVAGFGVHVINVVAGAGTAQPAILVRASGPAVDATGLGAGFSGSPIYCPDAQGVQRVIGAVSQSVGQYGNTVALATPIEAILGEPVAPPRGARRDPELLRRARPLGEPLVVGGVSPSVAVPFQRAAARAGRVLYVVPTAPVSGFGIQPLRPGSAVSTGLSSGDIYAGAIGTVAYTDGPNVWAFGHPLDAAGRRRLLLQDAYVYSVIDNPTSTDAGPGTYKLAAPGHDLGTVTGDGLSGVTGQIGAPPPTFPMHVRARSLDTGELVTLDSRVADESSVGLPTGSSSLSLVAPMAVDQAAATVLHGSPARQSGALCLSIRVAGLAKAMGFCNSYVATGAASSSSSEAAVEQLLTGDLGQALQTLDGFQFGVPRIKSVQITLALARGLRQGIMLGARALGVGRPGRRLRLALTLQHPYGIRERRIETVRIPRGLRRGTYVLSLTGTPEDNAGSPGTSAVTIDLSGGSGGGGGSTSEGPRSLAAVADAIAAIHRSDGVRGRFARIGSAAAARALAAPEPSPRARRRRRARPHGGGTQGRLFRDPLLRISGTASLRLIVRS